MLVTVRCGGTRLCLAPLTSPAVSPTPPPQASALGLFVLSAIQIGDATKAGSCPAGNGVCYPGPPLNSNATCATFATCDASGKVRPRRRACRHGVGHRIGVCRDSRPGPTGVQVRRRL